MEAPSEGISLPFTKNCTFCTGLFSFSFKEIGMVALNETCFRCYKVNTYSLEQEVTSENDARKAIRKKRFFILVILFVTHSCCTSKKV